MIEKFNSNLDWSKIPQEDYFRDSEREKLLIQQEFIEESKRDSMRERKFENDIMKLEFNDF